MSSRSLGTSVAPAVSQDAASRTSTAAAVPVGVQPEPGDHRSARRGGGSSSPAAARSGCTGTHVAVGTDWAMSIDAVAAPRSAGRAERLRR